MTVTLTTPAPATTEGQRRRTAYRNGRDWPRDILEAYARYAGPYTVETADAILDEESVELYNGWLVRQEMTDVYEREITGNIQIMLDLSARKAGFGRGVPDQVECLLSDGDVVKPDFALASWERLATAKPVGPNDRLLLPGGPELVVESRSPSNRRAQERRKRQSYFANGVQVVWDVDLRHRRIYVYRAERPDAPEVYGVEDVITCEPFLPGWQRRLFDIFSPGASAEAVAGEVAGAWIAEGRAEGETQMLRQLLPTLARYRFGVSLPVEAERRLSACDEAQLLHLQALLETETNLDAWLAALPV